MREIASTKPADVAVYYPRSRLRTLTPDYDAIESHAKILASELAAIGVNASPYLGNGTVGRGRPPLHNFDWVVLEYNPYSHARWGFCPSLLPRFRRSRRREFKFALFVHEAFDTPSPNVLRSRLIATWQKLQFRALVQSADYVFTASSHFRTFVTEAAPGVDPVHVPTFSMISRCEMPRASCRKLLGVSEGDLVLGALGGGHPDRGFNHISSAVRAATRTGRNVVFMNLGESAPSLPNAIAEPRVRICQPGRIPPADLSMYLTACDLFLAPFLNGACSRRSSVAAALSHALPVLATQGRMTDPLFIDNPEALCLVDADDPDRFAEQTLALLGDPERRSALGDGAIALYDAEMSPSVAARRVATHLGFANEA